MDNVELVVLVYFLKFLLVLLESKFSLNLLFGLFLKNLRSGDSCVHLYSFSGLLFILLSKYNIDWFSNHLHVLLVVVIELVFGFNNVFFDDLVSFLLYAILQSADSNVDVLYDIFALNVINEYFVFGLEK